MFFLCSTLFLCATASVFCQSTQPIVSHIKAIYDTATAQIVISWDCPDQQNAAPHENTINELYLYRSTTPIVTTVDLAALSPIAKLQKEQTNYIDTVSNYSDYYYAVIAITESGPYSIILPSINTTVTAVRKEKRQPPIQTVQQDTALPSYPAGTKRSMPLPIPDILENQNYTPLQMDEKAIAQAKTLGKDSSNHKRIQPYAFEEDMISPTGGDAYLLFTILHETFARKKYAEAIPRLEDFLAINHEPGLTTRAYFYLGECHYFTSQYENAVFVFLKTKDTYPDLSREWIYASLDSIDITN